MVTTTVEQRAEMRRLHAEGWGYLRLSRRFGITPSTARRHVDPEFRARSTPKARLRAKAHRAHVVDGSTLNALYIRRHRLRRALAAADIVSRRRFLALHVQDERDGYEDDEWFSLGAAIFGRRRFLAFWDEEDVYITALTKEALP